MLRSWTWLAAALLIAAGCRNDQTVGSNDGGGDGSAGMNGDGASPPADATMTGNDAAAMLKCAGGYTAATIATMRTGASGCFQLGVTAQAVVLASNPLSKTSKRLALQDAAGGDSSAIVAECSTSSTPTKNGYACSVGAAAAAVVGGHSVTVTGYYDKSTKFETFYITDSAVDSGTAVMAPAPLTLSVADASISSTLTAAKWYQIANVTLPANATLNAYDWAPEP